MLFSRSQCKTNGKFFPRSDADEVIGIACSVTDINCKDEPSTAPDSKHKMFGFCLKSVKPRTMAAYTFWYDDERELLSDFLFFVTRVINADVIEHYNGSGFDLPYLVNRAAHLGLPNFNLMGRSRNRRLNLSQMTNKGKEKNFVEIEARVSPGVTPR
jgi:DNA polymerase delta subunit 1